METASAASRIQANLQELFKANLTSGDTYIRFQFTSQIEALLSMEQVQESLVIDAQKITPLPNMPKSAIGMMSSRDRVFCIFDLAQLLALPSLLDSPRQYQIIVLETIEEKPIYLGLAVAAVRGMVRLPATKIESFSNGIDAILAPYVCGTVQQAEKVIPILEFDRIVETLSS